MLDYIFKKFSYKREERKRNRQDIKEYMDRCSPVECKDCKYVCLKSGYEICCKIKSKTLYDGYNYNDSIIKDCKYFKQKERS